MEKIKLDMETSISNLLSKYSENPYILNKLSHHINSQLPTLLANANTNHIERKERKEKLNIEKEEFINRFLSKNIFFYINSTNFFINYDNIHYRIYNEDDIHHEILSTLSHEPNLRTWKHKIKISILKQIRLSSSIDHIPDTDTIQYVINSMCPTIFETKYHVKYFLTIIGDAFLKKNDNLVYLTAPSTRDFLNELTNHACTFFGSSPILNSIKFKYYDHDYKDCRLLPLIAKKSQLTSNFCKNIMDLFCVATHYSNRFGSADEYLSICPESDLVQYALYLRDKTPESIIDVFINNYTQPCKTNGIIEYKNMLFLWKKFLTESRIPNIIFYTPLKSILTSKLKFNEELEHFEQVTSQHLPLVADFMRFWEESIVEVDNEDLEFEIDELVCLFKYWIGKSSVSIKDDMLIEWINHFYPDITIADNKYISNINCKLWDKKKDIITAIEKIKITCMSNKICSISINDCYKNYCKHAKNESKLCTVSKHYFERYLTEFLGDEIEEGYIIISNLWL